MKKIIAIVALCALTTSAFAQGTVVFNNRDIANGIDAKILDTDGTTGMDSSVLAQLWAGPDAGSLAAIGAAVPLRDGAGAGYLNTVGQDLNRSIGTVAPGGDAVIEVRAFSASAGDYLTAAATPGALIGNSDQITIATGGVGSPPSTPSALVGLQGFTMTLVPVPEPSVIVLGMVGAGLLWFRRKK